MTDAAREAFNHAVLVISLFSAWTIVLAYMGGKYILWDYDSFKDTEEK